MKHIKKFKLNEKVIVPIATDTLIDDIIRNKPTTIGDANKISNQYNIDIVDYDTFIDSVKSDSKLLKDVPPKNKFIFTPFSGIHFAILNKYTNNINIVVEYDKFITFLTDNRTPKELLKIVKSMIQHETIHLQQYNKMGNIPGRYDLEGSPTTNIDKYLSSKTEIMAYAFSIVDELKRGGHDKEQILDIINNNKSKGSWIINWYKDNVKDTKVFKKLRKYMYQYLEEAFKEDKKDSEPNIHDKININQEMKNMLTFEAFAAEPKVAPTTKPTTKPGTKPKRPSPIRRNKPSVDPRPKAELDDVLQKFADTASKEDIKLINKYYAGK